MLQLISDNSTISDTTSQLTPTAHPPPTESLNTTTQQATQLEILRLLRVIQTDFRTQRGGNNRGNPGSGRGTQGRNDDVGGKSRAGRENRANKKTPDAATIPRSITDKYCWTHGACNHTSSECNRKANRHKNATFQNKAEGSNAYCT